MMPEISKAIDAALNRPPLAGMDIVERLFAVKHLEKARSMTDLQAKLKDFEDGKRPVGFPEPITPEVDA